MHFDDRPDSTAQWKFKVKLPHCEIWQNLHDHSVAQAYLLPTSYLQKEQPRYLERKVKGVVNCLGIVYFDDNGYVLVERITNRLSNLTVLTQAQSLKVLYSVYKTLEEVYDVWEDFWFREGCICFNTEGDVKIWKNPELWNNYSEKTLLKGGKNEENTGELIRRVFRMVEERCINPLILEPFCFLSDSNATFLDGYSTAMKIGQKLFIDIEEVKSQQNGKNNVFFCRKVVPSKTFPQFSEKRPSNLDVSKEKVQKNIDKLKLKTERKTFSTHFSPIKQNTPRNRGFSGYEAAQKENFNPQMDVKKYESNPSSPIKEAFKKKQTDETFESRSKDDREHNIKYFERKPQKCTDFQTFGILEERNEESKNFFKSESPKSSVIDVAKMEEELKKFSEKKQQFKVQKKRSSLENLTEDFGKIGKFASTASGFLELNARVIEKEKESDSEGTVKNGDTIYNANPFEKKERNVKPYTKHFRKGSSIANNTVGGGFSRAKTPTLKEVEDGL